MNPLRELALMLLSAGLGLWIGVNIAGGVDWPRYYWWSCSVGEATVILKVWNPEPVSEPEW